MSAWGPHIPKTPAHTSRNPQEPQAVCSERNSQRPLSCIQKDEWASQAGLWIKERVRVAGGGGNGECFVLWDSEIPVLCFFSPSSMSGFPSQALPSPFYLVTPSSSFSSSEAFPELPDRARPSPLRGLPTAPSYSSTSLTTATNLNPLAGRPMNVYFSQT